MILLVGTEVLGEVVDSLGENGDLNFRGTRVALMACILLDDLCLFALCFPPFLKYLPRSQVWVGVIPAEMSPKRVSP